MAFMPSKKRTYPPDDSYLSVVELSLLSITIALCIILPSMFMLPVLAVMGFALIAAVVFHDRQ